MNHSPARIDPEEAAIGRPTQTARRLVEASVSPNTRRAYVGALRRLDTWLDGRPLHDVTLAAYLAELHDAGRASSSASMAVAAACFRAKLAGQPNPSGERTARVLAGYRRTAADRGRGQAGPFSASDLAAVLATCHRSRRRGDSLLELFALLFVEASERVLRRGLLSGYFEREDDLPMVRGRILGDRQVLERFGQLDRIICRFDELEHDVVENQLLTAALQVASPRVTSVGLQRRISRLRGVLEPICDTDQLDLVAARATVTYNRLNAHYETAHQLGWLLFDALGIDDLFAPGEARSFSFLLNMNQLFERFVTRVVEQVLPVARYRVTSQIPFRSVVWNVSSQRPYTNVIPDVVVERRGESGRVAIDAKYKLYDERGFDQSDIYQTFLYAFALGATASGGVPTSLLLYPATAEEPRSTRLRIRRLSGGAGAEIVGVGLPIASLLKELTAGAGDTPLGDGLATLIEQSFGNSVHHQQQASARL